MLHELPRAIAAGIVGWLYVRDGHALTSDADGALAPLPAALGALALVSREWHALTRDADCQAQLATLHLVAWSRTRRDVLGVRRRLALRSRVLRRLEVLDLSSADAVGLWDAALALAPGLTALRVYGVDVGYARAQLAEIVGAAGRFCPRVERLELPPFVNRKPSYPAYHRVVVRDTTQPDDDDDSSDDCPPLDGGAVMALVEEEDPASQAFTTRRATPTTTTLVDAVLQSAEAWRRHDRAGLKLLCLSVHDHLTGLASANAYVTGLANHCGGLEVIEGCQAMRIRQGQSEMWTIDVATWDAFARSCTQLTEFNWLPVPFATRFFEIFGRYEKPQLTKLTIATTERWNWATYMDELGVEDRAVVAATGYATTATNASAMLRGCPNLSSIEIQCFFPTGPLPNVMDLDQFGDAFCEALATHCPNLASLAIVPRYGYWTRPGSIVGFTDRSMAALARLPLLRSVHITGANITGDGLYTLVRGHARASRSVREYSIRLGYVYNGAELVDAALFYNVLEGFLVRLANETWELSSGNCRATLRLYNEGGAGQLDEWSLTRYLEKNAQLRDCIKARHPSVKIEQSSKGLAHWGIREVSCFIHI